MYIRYNKNTNRIIGISSSPLSKTKDTEVKKITKKEYNEIKDKNIKQLYFVNGKFDIISDENFDKIIKTKKEKEIEIYNRKKIEYKILDKYPYYKQINNIYQLLNVLEPFLKDLVKDGSEQEKAILNSTYGMISNIFNDLTKYKEAQKNKTKLSFQDNETNENDNN